MGTATISQDEGRTAVVSATPGTSRPLLSSLLTGMGALGLSLGFERGASFLSNVLAARLGGAATFGTYSLALTTANNVASYAGAGIGTTATRFVGQYPGGSTGYRRLLRVLSGVSFASAAFAAVILFLGARPLASILLHNTKLAGPLQMAALSAGGLILLECCRGLLIGERSYSKLVSLSVMVGLGLLLAIPATARFGASSMLAGQAGAVMLAVLIASWLVFRSLGSWQPLSTTPVEAGPSVWGVWRFGLVQLGGVVGLNAAGWWIATLVARDDPSMTQMAFFAIANQLRNVSTLVPSLVSQTSFPMMTDESGVTFGGSGRVLTVSSLFASLLATACAGMALTVLPYVLRYLYGTTYQGAELASAIGIVTMLIHMGSAPAAYRLTIISLRVTGIINFVWAVLVVVLGSRFVPGGGATAAAASFLAAHILSMILVLVWLRRQNALPFPVVAVSAVNLLIAAAMLLLSWLRFSNMVAPPTAALAGVALTCFATWSVWYLGQVQGCFPKHVRLVDLKSLLTRATSGATA